MKSLKKVIIWAFGAMVGLGVALAGGVFLYIILTEYQPDPTEALTVQGTPSSRLDSTRLFSILTWNIGYGGLGREMDFFYDGGKRVRPGKPYFDQSIEKTGHLLKEHQGVDFILLQEVDRNSKRSYYLDETEWLTKSFPMYCNSFAINYDCRFVPIPVTQPMGRVTSGLVTLSRYLPGEVTRHGFDKHVSWPNRLFYLKRCFQVSRYSLPDGHYLVLINIHNSAFDTGGVLRNREMEMISRFMLAEYRDGNYLVAGGDWNANPPGFDPEQIQTGDLVKQDEFKDLNTFFPGWEFVYDPKFPTNRNVDTSYEPGITPVTIIDFFLVSPNIKALNVKTIQTGFDPSDHQPVLIQIALNPSI